MRRIKKPSVNMNARALYKKCVDTFADGIKKQTALHYINDVEKASNDYLMHVPHNMSAIHTVSLNRDETEALIYAYTKFKGVDNCAVYGTFLSTSDGMCPYCSCAYISTLDHYLPKSKFPLLCVTPENLVPSCRDCNTIKTSDFSLEYNSSPFHPYFEMVDVICLGCKLHFFDDGTCTAVYNNCYDRSENAIFWNKCNSHFDSFDLFKRYRTFANSRINIEKRNFAKALRNETVDGLRFRLEESKNMYEAYDLNSWESSLYRALLSQIDDYCAFLERFVIPDFDIQG